MYPTAAFLAAVTADLNSAMQLLAATFNVIEGYVTGSDIERIS